MSKQHKWKCLICEKPVDIINEGDDNRGLWPNINGGTMDIGFGYGSDFDDMNNDIYHQAVIHDECYKKKLSLIRHVTKQKPEKWVETKP